MNDKGWLSKFSIRRSPRAVLPYLLLLSPAFFGGCDRDRSDTECGYVLTDMVISSLNSTKTIVADGIAINTIDLFVFNDDRLGHLDSYERIESFDGDIIRALSTSGEKILVAIANLPDIVLKSSSISCIEDVMNLSIRFEDEIEGFPVLSGITRFTAGNGQIYNVILEPVYCEIIIDRIVAGGSLGKVKVHLEDLTACCSPFPEKGLRPTEYIPEGEVADYYPGMRLKCYPNGVIQESPGSQNTKLVIEGSLQDIPFRHIIKINGNKGLDRNTSYYLNVNITDKGSGEIIESGSMTLFPGNFLTGADGDSLRVWVEVNPEDTEVVFDREDLEFDKERGIYDYTLDQDRKGVTLHLLRGGTGMFCIDAGPPVNDGCLVVVVCNP